MGGEPQRKYLLMSDHTLKLTAVWSEFVNIKQYCGLCLGKEVWSTKRHLQEERTFLIEHLLNWGKLEISLLIELRSSKFIIIFLFLPTIK